MSLRPTDEQRSTYLETFPAWLASDDVMARVARGNPQVQTKMEDLHVAGAFLKDHILGLGLGEATAEDICFKLGRASLTREVWDVVDLFAPQIETLANRAEDKKRFASTPVPQDVPEPTPLFTGWFSMAKNAVGDEGVYPQQYHRQASDGGVTIEAIAMSGNDMMRIAIERLKSEDVTEFVMGIDMSRAEGQGFIEFPDFLAVIWYVGGEFYTGVLNYQLTSAVEDDEEPAFRDVLWDNNYWANALREYPVADMQGVLTPT